jgi:hypothetical protein
MKWTQDNLGKTRGVVYAVAAALMLALYLMHRL